MLNKIITLAAVAVLAALLTPSKVDAWGAARVSATRVGPGGGVYHTGRTVAVGPGGVYAGGRTGVVGAYGGVYHAGAGYGAGYGGAYGGYRSTPSYYGGYSGGSTYSYIR